MKSNRSIFFWTFFIFILCLKVTSANDLLYDSTSSCYQSDDLIYRGKSRYNKRNNHQVGNKRLWGDYHFSDGTISPKWAGLDHDFEQNGFTVGLGLPKNNINYSFFYTYNDTSSKMGDWKFLTGRNNLFGGIAEWNCAGLSFAGAANAGFDKYTPFGMNDVDGWQMNYALESAFEVPVSKWLVRPHLGFDYHYLSVDDFSGIGDHKYDTFESSLGARINRGFLHNSLVLQGRVSWVHQYLDQQPIYQIRYGSRPIQTGPSILTLGLCGRDWVWCGIGLKYKPLECLHLYADYDLNCNEYQTLHTGAFTACLTW